MCPPDQAPQQGWSQMTAAQRQIIGSGYGTRSSGSTRRKRASRTASPTRRRKRASTSARRVKRSASRLVKGSAAAKRYMAKIRKLRRK